MSAIDSGEVLDTGDEEQRGGTDSIGRLVLQKWKVWMLSAVMFGYLVFTIQHPDLMGSGLLLEAYFVAMTVGLLGYGAWSIKRARELA